MTSDEFDCQFAVAVTDADRMLITRGRVDPLYLIVDRNRRAQVVVADNTSPERKHVSMTLARFTAIASDAELVSHQTEAWTVFGEATPGIAPSQSDRRREVVLVLSVARGEGGTVLSRFAVREIIRRKDGVAVGARPLEVPDDDGNLCGPLSQLLPSKPPTPAERRAARAALEHATKRVARGKAAFIRH